MDINKIIKIILQDYQLPWYGTHGVHHWGRVLDNALLIAEHTGANIKVVTLFALFHDSRRTNEGIDPEHGKRGAQYLKVFRRKHRYFTLKKSELDLLTFACDNHTSGRLHDNLTVQACWDADRLDLGRVGFKVDPSYLNTDYAKKQDVITAADERARKNVLSRRIKDVVDELTYI